MATKAQIDANRQNAQKSTGPRTDQGKAASSQNALKHGLCTSEAVIHGENRGDFDLHREAFLAEWRPVGVTESMLAERIVSLSWRLRRAELMQNQATDCMILPDVVGETDSELNECYSKAYGISPDDPGASQEYLPLGRIATKRWSDNPRLIERLFMHERRIESSLHRTMKLLKKLQLMRIIEQADAAERQSAARTQPAHDREGDLKKQSQFAPALMGTKSCSGKDYDDKPPAGLRGNEANQTQFERPMMPAHKGVKDKTSRAG